MIIFAAVHSALASRPVKELASRLAGPRYRNGLYRLFFCLQSLVMFAWAVYSYLQLPNRLLYRVPRPWSWLMRLGQAGSILMVWQCARVIGLRHALGLASLAQLRAGAMPEPEPEAQGPPLGDDGQLRVRGPYRYTRHGPNLAVIGVVWLEPRMTINWLTLAISASIYALIGSLHEESRLRQAYGERYRRYQQRVPFLFPAPLKETSWADGQRERTKTDGARRREIDLE